MAKYKNGTKSNPVKVFDDSEAFQRCRDRNQPTWVFVKETGELYKAYPSGSFKSAGYRVVTHDSV